MRTTVFLLLLPACVMAPAPEPALPAPELHCKHLYAPLRGRAGEPFGCLRQDDEALIVHADNPGGSRPFWAPRFSVRWRAETGWQVEWYFTSDDPDAWVIA